MKRMIGQKFYRLTMLATLAVLMMLLVASSAALAGGSGDTYRDGEIVVSLLPGTDVAAFSARYRLTVKEQMPGVDQYLFTLAAGERVDSKAADLVRDPQVLLAGPNFNVLHAEVRQRSQAYVDQRSQAYVDNVSPFSFYGQPQLSRLHLTEAQALTTGLGVKVAVIDTGVDLSHPLLARRVVWPNHDFVDNDDFPQDEPGGSAYGHGTFVAGLIALTAPGALIMPLRAFGPDGSGSTFNIAKAIRYATDNGAQVVNMSFGLLERDALIEDALSYAYSKTYFVASAGNDDRNLLHFPSERKSKTISVTSTDLADRKASFANYHKDAQASAPGVDLYSAYPGGRWANWSGTSFSTALVSGEAALLLQIDPTLHRGGVTDAITSSGFNLDLLNSKYAGKLGRRIDFLGAVNQLISPR